MHLRNRDTLRHFALVCIVACSASPVMAQPGGGGLFSYAEGGEDSADDFVGVDFTCYGAHGIKGVAQA